MNTNDRLNMISFKAHVKATAAATREQRAYHRSLVKHARKVSETDAKKAEGIRWNVNAVEAHIDGQKRDRRVFHLAYCYMKGRTYREVENTGTLVMSKYDAKSATEQMLAVIARHFPAYKYGTAATLERLLAWLTDGNVTRFDLEMPKKAVA